MLPERLIPYPRLAHQQNLVSDASTVAAQKLKRTVNAYYQARRRPTPILTCLGSLPIHHHHHQVLNQLDVGFDVEAPLTRLLRFSAGSYMSTEGEVGSH